MKAHGLTAYRLFSVSESAVNRIDLPEPARHDPTPEEKQQSRQVLISWVSTIGSTLFYLAMTIVVLASLTGLALYLRRERRRTTRPSPSPNNRPGVAVRGPVAPLRIPPR